MTSGKDRNVRKTQYLFLVYPGENLYDEASLFYLRHGKMILCLGIIS